MRRYCDTDENNSIIFTGQGTTGAIHKLIKLLNLKEYINFYKDLEILNDIYQEFFEGKNEKDITIELKIKFEKINKILINKIKENFRKLFQLKNFCYANRWAGFDCILCRMGFTTETQYNEHENGEIHKNNLKNFKDESDIEKSKMNFIDSISSKYLSNKNDNNYIYDLIKDYQKFLPIIFLSIHEHNSNSLSWRETGAKIIYMSTDYVFDGQGTKPWAPDCADYKPLNYYGETKLMGERVVTGNLEKYFIVRIAWVFGVNGNNFIKTMLNVGKTHDTLRVVNDQIGTPTYTFDLARLLVDMVETEKYGYFHATNEGGFISWYEFASEIFRQAAQKWPEAGYNEVSVSPVTTEEYGLSDAARPFNSRLDKSKLEDAGFKRLPVWQDALARYLNQLDLESI